MSLGMEVQSCIKATLPALAILCMVTWLPHMYSCIKTFFLRSLPPVVSAVVAPKCLFVFSNIIVVFLVSESKLSQSSSEPLNAAHDASARDDGLLHDRQEEEEVGIVTEALRPTITGESKHEQENNIIMVVDEEQDTSVVNEGVQMNQCEEEGDHLVLHEVDEVLGEVEEEGGELGLVLGEEVSGELEQLCAAEELEERDLPPADELNRRVEDFIARFNMERQLEARMLVCCY
ncbi:uncharacterized protein LOC133905088 [Phragmites australis]|uniref:uncharacterized protein LOC133905088 n=1 Tax=Phragmites australis TaxID=29695 RepID=UPI002D77F46E|nr:uncharacterized protein LOC133905088 [Phragmites australis]